MRSSTEALDAFEKPKIAAIPRACRSYGRSPAQFIEIMQLLNRGHPEIGMLDKLPIKPRSSSFLSSHAQEIRACITCCMALVFYITILAGARFEWPSPTHVALFSVVSSKSKPGARLAAIVGGGTRIHLDDLREFAMVDIHEDDSRYRLPMDRDAQRLAKKLPMESEIILLGSVATGKYVDVLLASFRDRLRFPSEFIGRGDM